VIYIDDLNEAEKKILSYIRKCMREGKQYFKSKHIAQDIELTPKEVGQSLLMMSEKDTGNFKIIKYAKSISTTWKVMRCNYGKQKSEAELPRKESETMY
jgi:hypothetical protein